MSRAVALLIVLAACPKGGDKPKPVEPAGPGDAQSRLLPEDDGGAALPPAPPLPAVPAGLPSPAANPRVTAEAVALGELLFHDPRLSPTGSRSCATCHDPAHGYAGGVAVAADGKQNLRRTPTLVNLAWVAEYAWDGRYRTLDDQLATHLKGQLGEAIDAISRRLAEVPVYRAHFARLGASPYDAVMQALEAYELTRYDGDAPWDRQERTALSAPGSAAADPILAGYRLFMGKAQCGSCHPPPLYTDGGYHRVAPNPLGDPGRGKVDPAQPGAFRTPTVRGAASRPAFFHTGDKKTLDEVIAYYADGPKDADPVLATIKLTPDETKQLAAFVRALTADRPPPTKPVLP